MSVFHQRFADVKLFGETFIVFKRCGLTYELGNRQRLIF